MADKERIRVEFTRSALPVSANGARSLQNRAQRAGRHESGRGHRAARLASRAPAVTISAATGVVFLGKTAPQVAIVTVSLIEREARLRRIAREYPVEWCAFNGGGHTPAPVDGDSNGSGGGDKTWTKGELWKFFTQF